MNAEEQLAHMIHTAWDEQNPICYEGTVQVTPSYNQLRALSRQVLPACGINPLEEADSVLRRITVRIFDACGRAEPDFKRLYSPETLRKIGIRNRVELAATVDLHLDKTNRLTIQLYRNAVGIAAVVFDQQVDDISLLHFAVHFITHEAQQATAARWDIGGLAWIIGWNLDPVKRRIAQNKKGILMQRPPLDSPKFRLGLFLCRAFQTLLAPFHIQLKQTNHGRNPAR